MDLFLDSPINIAEELKKRGGLLNIQNLNFKKNRFSCKWVIEINFYSLVIELNDNTWQFTTGFLERDH